MFETYSYLPYLKIRPSELSGLGHLPSADKDRLLPIFGLRRWRGANQFGSITDQISRAIGDRHRVVYVCDPEKLAPTCEAEEELLRLRSPDSDFANWITFIENNPTYVPLIQTCGPSAAIAGQAGGLLSIGRGLGVQLRRENAWNTEALDALSTVNFGGVPFLLIVDYGQIASGTDFTLLAAQLNGLIQHARARLYSADLTVVCAASSYPIDFAGIDRQTARLPIRERQLHELLQATIQSGVRFAYSDYASVYAGVRGIAQPGAPRIDLPKRTRWIYHRKDDGSFVDAAQDVINDPDWDNNLSIWGTECIRRAAGGDIEGFHYQQAWTAVRIHLHIHQQLHYDDPGTVNETDEEWTD